MLGPAMREGSRSRTSDWVAALRALYTEAPAGLAVIDDPAALRLIPTPLSLLVRSGARLPLGIRALHRAIGIATRGLSFSVPLRTAAIDDALRRSVFDGCEQLVVLGAGLDARAWRMPELERVIVFELDHPSTQAYKRERIGALVPLAREVRHAAIDFEQQSIADVLGVNGFDPSEPSIWVWEGVTMYLTRAAIEQTLDAIAKLAAPGSRLAITYLPPEFGPALVRGLAHAGARLIGESLRGTLRPEDVARALEKRGFRLESDEAAPEWARRHWPEHEAERVVAYERLAIAVRT